MTILCRVELWRVRHLKGEIGEDKSECAVDVRREAKGIELKPVTKTGSKYGRVLKDVTRVFATARKYK